MYLNHVCCKEIVKYDETTVERERKRKKEREYRKREEYPLKKKKKKKKKKKYIYARCQNMDTCSRIEMMVEETQTNNYFRKHTPLN